MSKFISNFFIYSSFSKAHSTILLFLFAFTIQLSSFAQAPAGSTSASPYPIEIKQPDSTSIKVLGKGNQEVSYTETVDGYTILKNKNGVYEYAVKSRRGKLCPGGIKAKNQEERSQEDLKYLEKTPKNLRYGAKYLKKLKRKRETSN